ncbi:putative T7SS-secreted protein [Amycolatopsis dongchuanensis]|uniref:Putative T7SS secretion signal domain-containing protein n=1 Tax=Amycolatopsis dongchuanensis TaxID=1070866 RepID=A0ABP9PTJ9_9PSEU
MAELGDTQDPAALIPGKPEAIEENARVLRARADEADNAAQGLLAVDTGSWEGPASRAFHDKFSYEPRKWFAAADALGSAADALENYAATLRWAQTQAGEAIARWNQGQAATARATAEHNQAVANNQPTPPFTDPGAGDRDAARALLARARSQLAEAGDTAADALRDGTAAAPEKSSWLDDVGNFVADVGAHLVNGLASFGNAMLNHPGDVLAAAAGAGLTVVSAAGEGIGIVLDATGVGAVAGVPLNAVSAAGMATGATITAGAVAHMAVNAAGDDHVEVVQRGGGDAEPTASPTPAKGLAEQFKEGTPPKASDLERYAESQGWTRTQTPNGPPKYVDENGIPRMTIKQGSSRTPGSENPHVELRNEHGQRIDPQGNPVNRRSPGNHTPIEWDLS